MHVLERKSICKVKLKKLGVGQDTGSPKKTRLVHKHQANNVL